MTKILFFDTETTGLPTRRASPLTSKYVWPEIVSISWQLYEDKNLVSKETFIIKPDGWAIPPASIKFHGITNEYAKQNGSPIIDIMKHFKKIIIESDFIVAHNMDFDKNVIFHAFKWRVGENPLLFWDEKKEVCSMVMAKNELKIPSKYPKPNDLYSFPGLDVLYTATFDEPAPPKPHSSDRDTEVLQKIVFKRWPELFV